MKKIPLFIDLRGRLVVVIGGGRVAQRKIKALLRYGARVRVYEPKPTQELLSLRERGVEIITRKVGIEDIYEVVNGATMVIVATNDDELNREIGEALKHRNVLLNVATSYELSTAIFPAILELDNVVVAVSTSGLSPFLASYIKNKIREELEREVKVLAEVMTYVRNHLKKLELPIEVKRAAYSSVIHDSEVVDLALRGLIDDAREKALKKALKTLIDMGFTG
ncbi:MAG: precorrin-2 dehydrogenase/sirohydrochlorin ferrochelatase family protein [Candidatus Nezhaarchaeales archaeon]